MSNVTKPQKPSATSAAKGATAQNTTGRRTLKELLSSIQEASPDDPIFKNGWIVGGHYPAKLKATPDKGSKS